MDGKGKAWIAGLVFATLLLVRCASVPPEARAGQWTAVTDIGTFTFTVDSSGTVITLAHVLITCQGNTVRMPGSVWGGTA